MIIRLRHFLTYVIIVISIISCFTVVQAGSLHNEVDLDKYYKNILETFEISGKVSLPEGRISPQGGIEVKIYLPALSGERFTSVYINEGKNSADYVLTLEALDVRLPYFLLEEDYGYYVKGYPIVEKQDELEDIRRNISKNKNVSNINFELRPCESIIYGKISFPPNYKCSTSNIITITASLEDNFTNLSEDQKVPLNFSRKILLQENTESVDYFLPVEPNSRYTLSYSFNGIPPAGYENIGFFHTNFNQIISVENKPVENIDIVLIHNSINKNYYDKRALTNFEAIEIDKKTKEEIINLEYTQIDNEIKFNLDCEYLDKLENNKNESLQINFNNFKLLGYNVYRFKDEEKDSIYKIKYLPKSTKEFVILADEEGTFNYYVSAVYEKDLNSLPSNIVTVNYSKNLIEFQIGNPMIKVKGNLMEIDPGNNSAPVVVNGRTLIPIRKFIEELGGEVFWYSNERRIQLELNGNKIELWLDRETTMVNGEYKTTDVAPQIINNRTMVPLRFVIENYGYKVEWDQKNKRILIKRV